MNADDLRWYPVSKGDLPGTSLGLRPQRGEGFLTIAGAFASDTEVAVGYPVRRLAEYVPPVAIVLKSDKINDTLAWLKVYAPEYFPLSQFARVISEKDWEDCTDNLPGDFGASDIWANVILGEMLAYSPVDADPRLTPLSRHLACYSHAIARVKAAHGNPAVLKECTDRLRMLENDKQFVRREVSVRDLVPIWAIAASGVTYRRESVDASEIVGIVLEAIAKKEGIGFNPPSSNVRLDEFPDLMGESIEKRVLAFQKLVAKVRLQPHSDTAYSVWNSAIVAAGAYLVGRGTGHMFLLRRYNFAGAAPLLWFSLFSAVHGPKGWDPIWARLVKGVERQIRTRFSWTDSSEADISWVEYLWTTRASSGRTSFTDIARLTARTLTIEIVPGASFQLRLAGDELDNGTNSNAVTVLPQFPPPDAESDKRLRAVLSQFVALADAAQMLLGKADKKSDPMQGAMPFDDQQALSRRSKAKSRSRRSTSPGDKTGPSK